MAVSATPVLVDLVALEYFGNFVGPYSSGGGLYIVLAVPEIGNFRLGVWKSSDSGNTWVSQDVGNQPLVANPYQVVFVGATIHVFHAITADLTDARYDMATDLFLTPVITTVPHDLAVVFRFAARADGSVVVIYGVSDTSIGSLEYDIFASGAWTGEVLIQAGSGLSSDPGACRVGVADAFDTAHLIYEESSGALFYRTIDSGGAVSGKVSFPITDFNSGTKISIMWSGEIIIAYKDASTFRTRVVFGAGATTNPATASWTSVDAWSGTLPGDSTDEVQAFPIIDGSGNLAVFFINNSPSLVTSTLYVVTWNGVAFNSPVVFYDPVTFPPPGTTGDVTLFAGSVALNGGTFQIEFSANNGVTDSTYFATDGGTVAGYFHAMY